MKGIVYGGLLSVVFVMSGCSGSQKEGRDSKEIPVEIVKVAKTVPADTRNYVGTVEEVVSSSISFQVMGNVERVLVGEGQKVREGQLLAVLDKATLENAYNASAASLRQAEDAYARMRTLHENKSLPDMKWVEVESKLEQARSMERISRKNLEDRNLYYAALDSALSIGNAILYAPFGGVIGKRMVEAGENVQPGQPVFSLLRIETVNVKIAVPENEVATLGDQAAMIKVAALGGQCFEGKVTEKGIVANPISHTYEAKIRLENPSGALLPGMVCDVRLSGEESVPAIALPNNAVLIANDGGRFVWKIVDGEAKATPVRTGDLTEQGLFILEGLNEGDIVVIGGYQKISEGMRVRAL